MFLLFFQNCYSYKKDMDIIHIYTLLPISWLIQGTERFYSQTVFYSSSLFTKEM